MQSVKTILDRIDQLDQLVSHALQDELDYVDELGAIEQARAFVDLRYVKDELDEVSKKVNKVYEQYKVEKLPAAFEAAGVPTISLEEGYRVTVQHRLHASIKSGKKDDAYNWLNENGLGDLITDTVNASTLSAAARSMGEDNIELPEEIFNVAILPNTSVTKVK